jgi:hypothetical protein
LRLTQQVSTVPVAQGVNVRLPAVFAHLNSAICWQIAVRFFAVAGQPANSLPKCSYLQKHDMIKYFGPFFDIVPSFDYCNYLVEFGKKLFSKLYTDLKSERA